MSRPLDRAQTRRLIERRRLVPVAIAAVAGAVLLGGCGVGVGLQSLPKFGTLSGPSYDLHAQFTNVLNLPVNAQVRDGSAIVGQVATITTSNFKADLVLKIRKAVLLPVGTTAQVRFDSPLGDEFVLLRPPATIGRPRWLTNGAVLPETDTSTAPSVEDTLAALAAVLNGGGLNQLQTIVTQLNLTFTGNQPELRSLISQLGTDFKSLEAHRGDLDNALSAIGNLTKQLNAGSAVITAGIDDIGPAAHVLARENTDLRNFLTQLTRLSSAADRIIRRSGSASVRDAKALLPVVNQLVGVETQLGPDLQNIADFESATSKVAPGNYLQVSVTLHLLLNGSPQTPTLNGGLVSSTAGGRALPNGGGTGQSSNGAAVAALLESGLP